MADTKQPKDKKKKEKPQKESLQLLSVDFIEPRLKKYEELKKLQEEPKSQNQIKITLPDGKVVDGVAGKTSPYDVAKNISKSLAEASVVAKVNGELYDLTRPLETDCKIELFKFDSEEGKNVFWHSSAHILGEALERIYGTKLCTGPPVEAGFFYDSFMEENVVTEEDFDKINKMVEQIIAEKQPFERVLIPKEEALELFKYNPFKYQILKEKAPDGSKCSVYRCGTLVDPCRGPHLPNTGRVKAFKVIKNSSSYWQGKAENAKLQRVYAISFPDAKQMEEWQTIQDEAAKRDHREIGKQQELFFFHALSPGSCFFLPHGTRVYNKLMELTRREYWKRGFTEVQTPNMFNTKLWEISGHWQNYKENMFSFKVEDQEFALKPMNCPGHCLMFGHRLRSYRELPIRFADFGVLHRNEYSGALTGLTRVRRFQQDDAHIFCTSEQIYSEMKNALGFLQHIYGIFGFEFRLELSTRPEKYLGDPELWNKAEKQLTEILNEYKAESGRDWKLNPGDGAFYGPKIDIHISDALKRSHQCATIQLDFQLPIRFDLEYVGANDNEIGKPVIIHRAIYGSLERFMAILIEHTGGKWPFWLSPRQAIVLPITDKLNGYAEEVRQALHNAGFYADSDLSDKKLQKKIRESQLAQYNYILVVGEKEFETKTVNIRTRDNVVHGTKSVQELIGEFQELSQQYK